MTSKSVQRRRKVQFEAQLVRAIEHGCPECGCHDFDLFTWVEHRYHLELYPVGRLNYELDFNGKAQNRKVICGSCNQPLWLAKFGWVAKLQKVVK